MSTLVCLAAASVPALATPQNAGLNLQVVLSNGVTHTSGNSYTVGAGSSVTLRANVSFGSVNGAPPAPRGQVQFCDAAYPHCTDIHLLGLSQLTTAGVATFTFRPGPGTHAYRAVLLPNSTFAGTYSTTVSISVTGFSTPQTVATTVSPTGSAGNYTLTASVPVSSKILPTGSVSFVDTSNSSYVLATAPLSAGSNNFAFGPTLSAATGSNPIYLATADFNGDGIPDIVVSNQADGTITVLLGKGDGTFTTKSMGGSGLDGDGVVVGDFNDDGIPDLAVAASLGNAVNIFLGKGDGTFSGGGSYSFPGALALVAGDFNGDGEADLAVITRDDNYLHIFLGTGTGAFTQGAYIPVNYPTGIATADFNGDGILDLLISASGSGQTSLLLGKGDGTFATGVSTGSNVRSYNISVADLNGDGKADFVATDAYGGVTAVELGNGDGTFQPAPASATGVVKNYSANAIGDFNADGIPDIVVMDYYNNAGASVLLGNGDGTFRAYAQSTLTGTNVSAVIAADLNGDGYSDLVALNYRGASVSVGLTQLSTTATATVSGVNVVGTGTHNIDAVYSGDANYNGSTSPTVPLTAQQVPTALALTGSAANGLPGQSVTFTGALTPSLAQTHMAGGAVSVLDGSTVIGTTSVANGAVSYTTKTLASGQHNITFQYQGDTNFAASTSAVVTYTVPQVGPKATTTTLKITVGGNAVTSVGVGTPVALTATVTANTCLLSGCVVPGPAKPGQVNFCDATAPHCTDIFLVGTAQVTANGTATLKFIPGIGSHVYRAVYVGNSGFSASASPTAGLSVTGAYPSLTVLTESGVPGNYLLTATVEGSGHVAPTGSVSILDTNNSGYVLAAAPLSAVTTGFSFYNSSTPPNGVGPESSAIGDFNGDGKLDMAVANVGTNNVTVLLGNGDGSFTAAASPGAGVGPIDIVTADFNNDGVLDLAVSNDTDNTLTILLGKGDGTFTLGQTVPTGGGPFCITVGDFDGDGNLDLATANIGSNTVNGVSNGDTVTVLLGAGDGTFKTSQTLATGSRPSAVVTADFNSDGKLDLAVANSSGSVLTMFFGNGDGTFTKAPDVATNTTPFWIVVADFNRDGQPDMAVGDLSTGSIAILLGKGDGTFTRAADIPTAGPPNDAMAAGDLNGDGIVDLAITNSTANSLLVVLGNGDGTFTQTTTPLTGATPDFVIAGDFDGDGNQDLAVANYGGNTTTVLLSKSTATATAAVTGYSPVGTGTHLVDAAYSGDSHFGVSTSNSVPLTAQRVPTATTLSANPGTALYGTSVALTATLSPNTAQTHLVSGTVSFYSSGTLLGTAAVVNGAATLNTTALPAGNDSETATYPGDTNFVNSGSATLPFAVTQYTPTLTFSVPNHVYLDPPFAVIAQSNSPGAITYSVVSGPATIAGNIVTLTGAGVETLQASQASAGVYAAATINASFTVAKAAQTITFPALPSPVAYGTPVALGATASSGLAVVYTVLSGPAVVSGSTLRLTGAGTVVVAADQPGNANFLAAARATQSIAVTPVYPAIILTATPNPVFVQNPVTFTATLGSAAGVPSGTVTFLEGVTVLGTASLSGGVAGFVTSSLALGSHTVTALYGGDSIFNSISSASVTVLVQDFTLVINNPAVVIQHGGTAVYSLTVTSVGGPGMAASIGFTQSGTPDRAGVSYSPATIATGAGTTKVTLTIVTPNYPVGPWGGDGPYKGALWVFGVGALLAPFGRRRARHRSLVRGLSGAALLLAMAVAVTGVTGCGSGWGTQHYAFTVTAKSGQLSRSAAATLETRP